MGVIAWIKQDLKRGQPSGGEAAPRVAQPPRPAEVGGVSDASSRRPETRKARRWKLWAWTVGAVLAAIIAAAFVRVGIWGHNVPRVIDLTVAQAVGRIRAAGLKPQVSPGAATVNRVCRQDPAPGDRVLGMPVAITAGPACLPEPRPPPSVASPATPQATPASTGSSTQPSSDTSGGPSDASGADAVAASQLAAESAFQLAVSQRVMDSGLSPGAASCLTHLGLEYKCSVNIEGGGAVVGTATGACDSVGASDHFVCDVLAIVGASR